MPKKVERTLKPFDLDAAIKGAAVKLKPFDLDAAVSGAAVVTRGGKKVASLYLHDDGDIAFPLSVYIEGSGTVRMYPRDGRYAAMPDPLDLFMAPPKLFANFYRGKTTWVTKADARSARLSVKRAAAMGLIYVGTEELPANVG